MVSQTDFPLAFRFCFVTADDELPELPIEHGMLDKLKQRILVARKIDAANHKVKKDNHEKSWIKEAAEALEIDIDSDNMSVCSSSLLSNLPRLSTPLFKSVHLVSTDSTLLSSFLYRPTDDDDDEDTRGHRGNAKSNAVKVANLKNELRALMAQPLVARGISSRYITGGSRKIVDALIQGTRESPLFFPFVLVLSSYLRRSSLTRVLRRVGSIRTRSDDGDVDG